MLGGGKAAGKISLGKVKVLIGDQLICEVTFFFRLRVYDLSLKRIRENALLQICHYRLQNFDYQKDIFHFFIPFHSKTIPFKLFITYTRSVRRISGLPLYIRAGVILHHRAGGLLQSNPHLIE